MPGIVRSRNDKEPENAGVSGTGGAKADIQPHRGYEPGLIGRVGELPGRYYAMAWQSGAPLEILISLEFCDFIER
jgi:hypothetical protein